MRIEIVEPGVDREDQVDLNFLEYAARCLKRDGYTPVFDVINRKPGSVKVYWVNVDGEIDPDSADYTWDELYSLIR